MVFMVPCAGSDHVTARLLFVLFVIFVMHLRAPMSASEDRKKLGLDGFILVRMGYLGNRASTEAMCKEYCGRGAERVLKNIVDQAESEKRTSSVAPSPTSRLAARGYSCYVVPAPKGRPMD